MARDINPGYHHMDLLKENLDIRKDLSYMLLKMRPTTGITGIVAAKNLSRGGLSEAREHDFGFSTSRSPVHHLVGSSPLLRKTYRKE